MLRKGRLAVLCNQSAWNPETEEYLFESLCRRGNLKRIFYPGTGIFGESDAVSPAGAGLYSALGLDGCEFVPLLTGIPIDPGTLEDIDALIVEYQDTGSRYDSMTALLHEVFRVIHHDGLSVSVYILDRENICGRWVEGTASDGIPHRHGLTLGELANLFYSELGARFPLHIISYMVRPATQYLMPWSIPPRPDVPGLFTSNFYCGMPEYSCAGRSLPLVSDAIRIHCATDSRCFPGPVCLIIRSPMRLELYGSWWRTASLWMCRDLMPSWGTR